MGTICTAVLDPGIVSLLKIRSTIEPLDGPIKSKSSIDRPIHRLWRGLAAPYCSRAVRPFGILRVGRYCISAIGQALDVKSPLDWRSHNWIWFFKELVGRTRIRDVRPKADVPVREGPIAERGDQVQVVLHRGWLVAARVEVGVAAVVDSAFQLVHVQRELPLPLALAVPVLGLLLV